MKILNRTITLPRLIHFVKRKTRSFTQYTITITKQFFLNYLIYKIITINIRKKTLKERSLGISTNKKFLLKPDGMPFFWLGDTAWELFHKLNREDAQLYLKNRANKGFTIIQAVVLAELGGLSVPNAYGHLPLINNNPSDPNPDYFKHVDFIVDEAEKAGLFIGMLPTWGDKVTNKNGGEQVIFNRENAYTFGLFLGNRYKEKPIVWILGGDRNVYTKHENEVWTAMAKGLRNGDNGRHLISYHPQGGTTSYGILGNEATLDFNMYQSGHNQCFNPVYQFAAFLYRAKPRKPFIDAEPAYEDIPVSFWEYYNWQNPDKSKTPKLNVNNTISDRSFFAKGFFTDYDIRIHAYWNFLSGACGYSYGANAIWQMFEKNGSYAIPCLTDWREAMELPGAKSLAHFRKIFELYPFEQLKPCQKIIANANSNDDYHIRTAKAADDSYILTYLSVGQSVTLKLRKHIYQAQWYNPRTGNSSPLLGTYTGKQTFTPLTSGINNDWLLILVKQKNN